MTRPTIGEEGAKGSNKCSKIMSSGRRPNRGLAAVDEGGSLERGDWKNVNAKPGLITEESGRLAMSAVQS